MALDMNDIMALKSLESGGMSPYEQVKVGYMQSKRPSGTATAGLVLGSVGTALAVGAWIFAPIFAKARAAQAREAANAAKDVANANFNGLVNLIAANNNNTNETLNRLINTVSAERNERIAGDLNITTTISDTLSGTQQGQLTAQQQAELAASQVATQQVMTGLMTGQYSQNPSRVVLVRGQRECECPASGCGCNG